MKNKIKLSPFVLKHTKDDRYAIWDTSLDTPKIVAVFDAEDYEDAVASVHNRNMAHNETVRTNLNRWHSHGLQSRMQESVAQFMDRVVKESIKLL